MTSSPDRGRAVTPHELRNAATSLYLQFFPADPIPVAYAVGVLRKAADRIAELEAANARFKHALELIAYDEHPCIANWQNTARVALGEEK